jgi:hypothetical protein
MPFSSDRHFRLWDYTVSHNQMLLRSPAGEGGPKNIDIIFLGVDYVGIPSMLDGVGLGTSTPEDVMEASRRVGQDCEPGDVHVITSAGRRFLVVAAAYYVFQNDLDLFESSLEYFTNTEPARDRGEVLVRS